MKRLVCKYCGSEDLDVDAFVHWDFKGQQFTLSNLASEHLEYTYADCANCGEHDDGVAIWEEVE
jgi:DNA-directed RNA polymerase subunit RPC12/RpoP